MSEDLIKKKVSEQQKLKQFENVRERYLKNIQAKYLGKQSEARRFKRAKNIISLTLGGTVLAIYAYSMYAVGNETIMDDIDKEIRQSTSQKEA